MNRSAFSFCRSNYRAPRRGQTLVEYALIIAFIAVVAISVLVTTGMTVKSTYNTTQTQMELAQHGGVYVAPPSH